MSQIQALDFSVDLLRSLLWQHNKAARLEELVRQKQAWYDTNQSAFWEDWVRDVFDLRTANDFGLSVWAIILDIPLVVTSPADSLAKPLWGFGAYHQNFTRGNFASASSSGLTTSQKRLVLQLRYFQLVNNGTVPQINEFLSYVFSSFGNVYVLDNLNMTASYVFGFALPADLRMILTEYDLLPRPAAVEVNYIVLHSANGFGFGDYHSNFNNGNFYYA